MYQTLAFRYGPVRTGRPIVARAMALTSNDIAPASRHVESMGAARSINPLTAAASKTIRITRIPPLVRIGRR